MMETLLNFLSLLLNLSAAQQVFLIAIAAILLAGYALFVVLKVVSNNQDKRDQ